MLSCVLLAVIFKFHCEKNVRIRNFSGPYFPVFGLSTKVWRVNICIQSVFGKYGPEKLQLGTLLMQCFLLAFPCNYLSYVNVNIEKKKVKGISENVAFLVIWRQTRTCKPMVFFSFLLCHRRMSLCHSVWLQTVLCFCFSNKQCFLVWTNPKDTLTLEYLCANILDSALFLSTAKIKDLFFRDRDRLTFFLCNYMAGLCSRHFLCSGLFML